MNKIATSFILLVATTGFAQNILRNGDFENLDAANGGQVAGQIAVVTGVAPTTTIWHSNQSAGSNTTRPFIITGVNANNGPGSYLNLPDGFMLARQSFTAVVGTEYTLSFWSNFVNAATITAGNIGTFVSVRTDDGLSTGSGTQFSPSNQFYIDPLTSGSGYVKYTYNFTAQATNLILVISKQSRTGTINNAQRLDDFSIVPTASVWTGATSADWTEATNWSNGVVPTATDNVTIKSGGISPIISSNVSIASLRINAAAALTVSSGSNLTVSGSGAIINNGSLVMKNNANLLQSNLLANSGSGTTTVERNSSLLSRLDHTIWSTPTTNPARFLKTFSPATLDSRFFTYNEATNAYAVVANPAATTFTNATGYLIRTPNTHVEAPDTASFAGVFIGVPNNGTITKAVAYNGAALGYNMIGNPYPSTIDANAFITANSANIESTIYFWRKSNAAVGSGYATWNQTGSVGTASGAGSEAPNGTIQVGQGFFVKAKSASNVTFTNAIRLGTTSTQFFRNQTVDKSRFWLNLTNTSGVFSQTLVGYIANATQGEDDFDGKYINDSAIALTSIVNNNEYTIQGRALPFALTDTVALGFKTDIAGTYTIAIDHRDGLFANGQDIYLIDNLTGMQTNLSTNSYTFSAVAGVANSRFSIVYQSVLNVALPEFSDSNVVVFKNDEKLNINAGATTIKGIKIFDIQGRLIAEQNNINATTATFENLRANQQVLIVQITSTEQIVVSKKFVN